MRLMKETNGKIIKFKNTLDEISAYANRKCDEGDYSAALYALFYYTARRNFLPDVYAQMADIYAEMGLFDRAIEKWGEFLALSDEDRYADGYNGLGANYFFKGDRERADYYFEKQFAYPGAEDCVYNDVVDEFLENPEINRSAEDDFRSRFKVAYSSDGKVRRDELIEEARGYNAAGNYPKAIERASEAAKDDRLKGDAFFQKAFAEFASNDASSAAGDMTIALESMGDKADVKEFTLAALVYGAVSDEENKNRALDKLENVKADDEDGRSKHVAIFYEFGRNASADKLLKRYLDEFPYEYGLLFLKGAAAYNRGDYDAAERAFSEGYAYSESPILLYYKEEAFKAREGGAAIEKVGAAFSLPDSVVTERTTIIAKLYRKEMKIADIGAPLAKKYFDWAISTGNESLQIAVGLTCMSSGEPFRKYLAKKLTLLTLDDDVKRKYLSMLSQRHYNFGVGVIFDGYYKRVVVDMPYFDERGLEIFSAAYAYAVGFCAMLFDCDFEKFYYKSQDLQRELISKRAIGKIKDPRVLACAMFLYSRAIVMRSGTKQLIYEFFGATKESVDEILAYTKAKEKV